MESIHERTPTHIPRAAVIAVLAFAALIPFVHTIGFGYVLDDTAVIQSNPDLAGGWRSLIEVWRQPYGGHVARNPGLYRPMLMAVFAAVWNAGGHSAFWFHILVVGMHVGTTVLAWRLLSRSLDQWPATLAALWFAVHPLHVEVVANITNSSELLVALWTCALALYLARVDERGAPISWRQALVAGVLYLAAFLTKESGVVAPLLACIWVWGWRRPPVPSSGGVRVAVSRWWPVLASWTVAAAIVLAARSAVIGGPIVKTSIAAPGLAELSTMQRVWAMLSLGPKIVGLLIWPVTHNPYYGPSTFPQQQAIWAVLTVAGLALLVWVSASRARRGDRRMLTAVAWTIIAFLPASNLLVPTGQVLGERTLYISSIGVAMLLGLSLQSMWWAVKAPWSSRVFKFAAVAVVVMIIAASAIRTAFFATLWRSHALLFAQMIQADSANYKGYWMAGLDARYQGRLDDATMLFAKAYQLYPTDRSVVMDYSMALSARGEHVRAVSVAARLMESPKNRKDARAMAFYLAAVARAFGPESVSTAARRLSR